MFAPPTQGNAAAKQQAVASNTFAAAGTASLTPTLPGGATGKPIYVRVSGSVAGYVTVAVGTQAQFVVLVNPNAPFTQEPLPASAFPSPVNAVPVSATAAGAGTISVVIGFA